MIAECIRTLQGGEWSVREVLDVARTAGVQVREKTAYEVLYNLDLPGRKARPGPRNRTAREAISDTEKIASGSTMGSDLGSDLHREAISPRGSLSPAPPISPNPSLFTLTSFGMPGENAGSSRPKRSKKAQKPVDLAWIAPLEEATVALHSKALESLSYAERLTVARYHALHFAGCTREAIKNQLAGTKIAAGLMGLGSDLRFRDMTVREYLLYAQKVHKNRNGYPWFDPWLIKGVVEFEQA